MRGAPGGVSAVSHLHIPDGVLPFWLWSGGWLLALAAVWVASTVARRADIRRKVPLLGVVSALVLVSMSSEIVPIAYHVNLTVVAGVLLGPWLGVISAFIVVLILALMGHGGVTVAGLNALMIGAEMAVGWALFRAMIAVFGRRRVKVSAFVATVVTLTLTTTLLVGLVALAGAGGAATRETGALDPSALRFTNPFAEGVFSVNTLRGEGGGTEVGTSSQGLSVGRFAAVVYTLGPLGWLIEGLITSAILGYVSRVRPSLVFAGALRTHRHPLPGHGREAA